MYAARYNFYPGGMSAEEYYDGPLSSFLAALKSNGQISGQWTPTETERHIEFQCLVPDIDSLEQKYHGESCARALEALTAQSEKSPEHTIIGPVVKEGEACKCESARSYVLLTSILSMSPPVICTYCGQYVPLYRLPYPGDRADYRDVLGWEATYKAIDRLYIGSGVGELFALKQMRSPKSELTVEGLSICRNLAAKAGKPFYYYLDMVTRLGDPKPTRRCPSCGDEWQHLEEPLAGWLHRECERCGFVTE